MPIVDWRGPPPFGDGAKVMFGISKPADARPRRASHSSEARILKAAVFAAERHKDQRRKNASASPYVGHPLAVAGILADIGGITDPDTLCAALLHDTVEDTDTTLAEIAREFGDGVAGIVGEVTDDVSLSRADRKRAQIASAPGKSVPAKLVKIADKIANLRDMTNDPPVAYGIEQRRSYADHAALVVAGLGEVNAPLAQAFTAAHTGCLDRLQ